jgi:hypothetical protein
LIFAGRVAVFLIFYLLHGRKHSALGAAVGLRKEERP